MPPFLRILAQHPEIIYIVLAIGLPVLGRTIKGINDKRRQAEQRRLAQRAELEALRTGRAGATSDYPGTRPAAPPPGFESSQPQAQPTYQAPAPPPPQATARVGKPRYVQLPGGVVLELPPPPQGQAGAPQSAPRPAAPRPNPVARGPAPRPARTQRPDQRPVQRPGQRPVQQGRPGPTVPDRLQSSGEKQASSDAARAQRRHAERMAKADAEIRAREERAAEERRRATDERTRQVREEQQRRQTSKIVDEAYRQDETGAPQRPTRKNPTLIGGVRLSPGEWRRIFVLREIMDKPVTFRDEL